MHGAQTAARRVTIIGGMTNPDARPSNDPAPVEREAFDDQHAAPAGEQQPAHRVPTTFRAVEKLNPDLDPFIFLGF